MITTESILLDAILAQPQDDLPRLAYADYLEETGTDLARAEFIRVQLLTARLAEPCGCTDDIPCRPHLREGVLTAAHAARWFSAAMDCPCHHNGTARFVIANQLQVTDAHFHRGFVYKIACSLATWQQHGKHLVQTQPIEQVTLFDRSPSQWSPDGRWYWYSQYSNTGYLRDRLPPEIYQCLPRGVREDSDDVMVYTTQEEANTALSVAALLWAQAASRDAPLATFASGPPE